MKQKTLGQLQLPSVPTRQGFIMIVAVIIISAVISVVAISVTLGSLTQLQKTDTNLRGEYARYYVESCMQEALIQLNMDNTYSGGTLTLAGSTCTVVISGIGNSRVIDVEGSSNDYYYDINASVSLVPFYLDSWDN
jgi:hypothetical protein